MSRQSSNTVTYADLLALAERVKAAAEKKLAGAHACGAHSLEGLTHDLETANTLVRMLKKGLPGKQTDFLELFQSVNK